MSARACQSREIEPISENSASWVRANCCQGKLELANLRAEEEPPGRSCDAARCDWQFGRAIGGETPNLRHGREAEWWMQLTCHRRTARRLIRISWAAAELRRTKRNCCWGRERRSTRMTNCLKSEVRLSC